MLRNNTKRRDAMSVFKLLTIHATSVLEYGDINTKFNAKSLQYYNVYENSEQIKNMLFV